ncbi:MAG: hypothetical protein MJ236_06285, partial [Clostridia bacterium]|nr:hypothetical protein [Clostridia bacterium]
ELKDTNFKCNKTDMDKLSKGEPCLVLMNHSSFTDLQIVATLFSDIGYHIVCTRDGFVGKDGIMRAIGCIPTDKFVTDIEILF